MRFQARHMVFLLVMTLAVPTMLVGQVRGIGRITGSVTDDSGASVKGVSIRATKDGSSGVIEATSDAKGEWALNGMARGEWQITFQLSGYVPAGAKVNLAAEFAHIPPIGIVLKKVKS